MVMVGIGRLGGFCTGRMGLLGRGFLVRCIEGLILTLEVCHICYRRLGSHQNHKQRHPDIAHKHNPAKLLTLNPPINAINPKRPVPPQNPPKKQPNLHNNRTLPNRPIQTNPTPTTTAPNIKIPRSAY